jgi:hypothetical protein
VPFDKTFFEAVLPQAIAAFCKQVQCGDAPIVELLTVDGTRHFVKGIAGVSDSWVALHTSEVDHQRPVEVFIPYATIFRIAVQPATDLARHHLGFAVGETRSPQVQVPVPAPAPAAAKPAAARKAPAAAAGRRGKAAKDGQT